MVAYMAGVFVETRFLFEQGELAGLLVFINTNILGWFRLAGKKKEDRYRQGDLNNEFCFDCSFDVSRLLLGQIKCP